MKNKNERMAFEPLFFSENKCFCHQIIDAVFIKNKTCLIRTWLNLWSHLIKSKLRSNNSLPRLYESTINHVLKNKYGK
jgi:hypothetical protein